MSNDMKFEIVVVPVWDVDRALRARGVEVSEVFHSDGVYAGAEEPYLFGRRRTSGADPKRGSYRGEQAGTELPS